MWSAIAAVLNIFASLFQWLRERSLKQAGQIEAESKTLKDSLDTVVTADEARDEARVSNASVPQSDSLPDDGFRRD